MCLVSHYTNGSQVLKLANRSPGSIEQPNELCPKLFWKPLSKETELFGDLLTWHQGELVYNIRSDLKYLCIKIFSDKFECT